MALTETWLHNHKDAELFIDGYKLFRADRKRRKKSSRGRFSGGVGLYVRSDLACTMEIDLNYSSGVVEVLALHSTVANLYIVVLYRQPDDLVGNNRSTEKEFQAALKKIGSSLANLPTPSPNIIICGDFNIPHVSWPIGSPTTGSSTMEKEMLKGISELSNEHFLSQQIMCPTHIAGGTLDLLFCNNDSIIHSYSTLEPLRSTSDHFVVEVNTPILRDIDGEEETKPGFASPLDNLNFHSSDIEWDELSAELDNRLESIDVASLPPSEKLDAIMQILIDVAYRYVPAKKTSKRNITQIPRERRILMRKRRKLQTKLKSCSTTQKMEKIRKKLVKIELQLQTSHKDGALRRELNALKAIKSNPRYFFTYAKQFSSSKSKIGPLLNEHNDYTNSSEKMANILLKQYSSVFSEPAGSPYLTSEVDENAPTLSDFQFTEKDLIDAIDELSNSSASGPDGVSAIFLKKCKTVLCKPLYDLWRQCLDLGMTPANLKGAHIIPIHKGGHQGLAVNYRPIALTSHLIKIFEKVVRNNLVAFLEENDLLNDGQHGFRIGRSCLSQLLNHYDNILSLLEKGLNVDTVYLDFAKAFDKVDHRIVLKKLSLLGIQGKILNWLESFLTSRTQKVMVNGVLLEPASVVSGVPQGSVIGPLLFLILIGDIDAAI